MNNHNAFLGSAHRDVLEATPTSVEDKKKLVEEIKNRGRAAVMASAFPDATLLYQKGIDVLATITNDDTTADHVGGVAQEKAVLYANLSLVQRNMGDMEKARRSAQSSTQLDATYVKGWWRLGQALQSLHRNAEALEALTKAKELEPQNKALIKECQVLAKKLEEEKALMSNDPAIDAMQIDDKHDDDEMTNKNDRTTTKTKTSKPLANKSSSSSSSTTTKSSSSSSVVVTGDDDDDDEENLFKKSDVVKGYKTVNGKKTSYFHKELSEEEKRLIGDIAPKKLDSSDTAAVAAAATNNSNGDSTTATAAVAGGASVWNQAGTWEERDVTAWAEDTLKQQLLQATFVFPASSPAPPGTIAKIVTVSSLTGHASFAIARGKKRYIYEFFAKVQWQLHVPSSSSSDNDNKDELKCTGTMTFPDIDGTCELGDGYDMVDYSVDDSYNHPSSLTPLLDRFVKNGGLRESIHQQIDDWVRLFRQTY